MSGVMLASLIFACSCWRSWRCVADRHRHVRGRGCGYLYQIGMGRSSTTSTAWPTRASPATTVVIPLFILMAIAPPRAASPRRCFILPA